MQYISWGSHLSIASFNRCFQTLMNWAVWDSCHLNIGLSISVRVLNFTLNNGLVSTTLERGILLECNNFIFLSTLLSALNASLTSLRLSCYWLIIRVQKVPSVADSHRFSASAILTRSMWSVRLLGHGSLFLEFFLAQFEFNSDLLVW